MLGFPTPYPDELIYSTIARAGVHDGDTSPKQLLDKVYNDRGVIATVDMPSHVGKLANQYSDSLGLHSLALISLHTLWPIYAPFLPRERNNKLRVWMNGSSQGAAHLASGIAASRIKAKDKFYVCPECLQQQKFKLGECFWNRLWQIPLVKTCPLHGSLFTTNVELDGKHRHSYIPVESAQILQPLKTEPVDHIFCKQAAQLFEIDSTGISFSQWTEFYKQFASNWGYLDGRWIDHAKIEEAVIQFWGERWLYDVDILPSGKETSWLRQLFRKHRKSFSFAEHIVALLALSDGEVKITDAIEYASSIVISGKARVHKRKQAVITESQLSQDQLKWKKLLKQNPPKVARSQTPALYARLYRNHHDWLMDINKTHRAEKKTVNKRVDWLQRDRVLARELRRVCKKLSEDLQSPLLSRTFLINQLNHRATIEKNLYRLPRCSALLSLYSESTSDYQVRRITRSYLLMLDKCQKIKRWSLLREAGLSEERITATAAIFLKEVISEHG